MSTKINLLDFPRKELDQFFTQLGEKTFRTNQVLKWVHQLGVSDFDAMSNLSKKLRAQLQEIAEVRAPEVVLDVQSEDGSRKWVLKMDSGNHVEMVFIPESGRGTLCVSSQIGCALECSFCSTARQGFNRNLSVHEIIGQLWVANKALGYTKDQRVISNVVLMGMGEPLLNFDNVVKATDLMMDDFAYGLSKRRVTLSTAGVVPALYRLAKVTDISLALSLHAPNDELRNELVPLNRKYPIAEVLEASEHYVNYERSRLITIEYVMLKGVNDQMHHAEELIRLLRGRPVKVNLIPFNPFPQSHYERSSAAVIRAFQEKLVQGGLNTVTRKTRGDDIDAACGQLVGRVEDKTKRTTRNEVMVREAG
ncbi:MAG: 23S rRNA (adenine(2503)-C(2))-methyltransferase RlmN [Gammaproteobacteria bacterium]|nr:23S rRNA (adenine(2503)-C(2))-methyltransferase RlmN [Gammaproteobacteria bacterium]MDH5800923.1 23S rRNA (adenine(2503)-C(2))-methyltransferase RlmN [Gammaproteobacteria bacterium]